MWIELCLAEAEHRDLFAEEWKARFYVRVNPDTVHIGYSCFIFAAAWVLSENSIEDLGVVSDML
jgi:hypothetical protein